MYTVESGNDLLFDKLLSLGADVNHTANFGWNAIIWASYGGHVEMVRKLIEHGAVIDSVSKASTNAKASKGLNLPTCVALIYR